MSGGLGATGVGELFAASPKAAGQERAAGLQDVLVRKRPAVIDSTPPADSPAELPEAAEAPAARGARQRRPQQPPQKAEQPGRLLVVYVTQEDLQWVSARRKAADLTNAQIVLSAVESAADRLPEVFRAASTPPRTGGMFAATAARAPKAGPRHVQLGLNGVPASDRAVLDQLVVDVGAGSVSALVRAALQLARAEGGGL
jgi:hypothetical protein